MLTSFARSQAGCYFVMATFALIVVSCTTDLELPAATTTPVATTTNFPPPPTETAPAAVDAKIKDAIGEQEYNELSASIGANGEISGTVYEVIRQAFEGKVKTETITSKTTADYNFKTIINAEAVDEQGKTFQVVWNPETNTWAKVITLNSDPSNIEGYTYIYNIDKAVETGDFDLILLSQGHNAEAFPLGTAVPQYWINTGGNMTGGKFQFYQYLSNRPLSPHTNPEWEEGRFTRENKPVCWASEVFGRISSGKEVAVFTQTRPSLPSGNMNWHYFIDINMFNSIHYLQNDFLIKDMILRDGFNVVPAFPFPLDIADWKPENSWVFGNYLLVDNFQKGLGLQQPGQLFDLLPDDLKTLIRNNMLELIKPSGGRPDIKYKYFQLTTISPELAKMLTRSALYPSFDEFKFL